VGPIVAVLASVAPAPAATFSVNSAADAVDAVPGDGVCETGAGNGVCTLRAAIQEANALPGADIITLPSGTYTLGLPDSAGASDLGGDLNIRADLTIVGAGAGTTIVQACTVDQKTAPCPAGQGVADRVIGLPDVLPRFTVELRTSSGGGIENLGHTLVLRDSVVADNNQSGDGLAGIGGGGIYSSGPVSLFDSAVRDNTAGPGGGGISTVGPPASALALVRSTVSGNTVRSNGGGGGIQTANALTVINSTVSGKTAAICGGISFFGTTGLMNSSTITGNAASRSFGGGVCSLSLSLAPSFTVANTIVAGNTDTAAAAPDCIGPFISLGFNLIGNGAGCGTGFAPFVPSFVDGVNGDQVGTGGLVIDPRLGPLADNGGPTLTHALLPGSPALGTGSPEQPGSGGNACESTDQRGVARPQPAGGRCDIGAVEGLESGVLALGRIQPTPSRGERHRPRRREPRSRDRTAHVAPRRRRPGHGGAARAPAGGAAAAQHEPAGRSGQRPVPRTAAPSPPSPSTPRPPRRPSPASPATPMPSSASPATSPATSRPPRPAPTPPPSCA